MSVDNELHYQVELYFIPYFLSTFLAQKKYARLLSKSSWHIIF